jgi:hypothetical protein
LKKFPCSEVDLDGIAWKTALSLVGAKNQYGNEYRNGSICTRDDFDRVTSPVRVMFFYCKLAGVATLQA